MGALNLKIGPNGQAIHTLYRFQRIIPIASISLANPTVITTTEDHGLRTNDWVVLYDTNTFPNADNGYQVTRITNTTFSVPLNVDLKAGNTGKVGVPINMTGWSWTGNLEFAVKGKVVATTARAETRSGSRHVILSANIPDNFEFLPGQFLSVEGALNNVRILDVGEIDSVFPGASYRQTVYVESPASASISDGYASAARDVGNTVTLAIAATPLIGRLDITFPPLSVGLYDFSLLYSISGGASNLFLCDQLTVEC
jgi:hypothetical protein